MRKKSSIPTPSSNASTARRPLKIAQVAPIIERVPPKKYGGTERVVAHLAEGLVERGHAVTLFASGDSITSAELVSVYPRSLREAKFPDLYGLNSMTLLNVGMAYATQHRFDVIHDHVGYIGLPIANLARKPTVITYHGPITGHVRRLFQTFTRPSLVTISKSQARGAADLHHAGTIYNGLDMESYPFSPTDDGYLLSVGRISMEKGTHHAIDVAQYLNLPLIIAAKLDAADLPYFHQYIGPRLSDEQIRWVGEVDTETRNNLMSKALCLLHPNTWSEPFGLTLIEAMACGAPVVGFNRGSIPELIVHGKTGFIVDTVDEMIEAVRRIGTISRANTRQHALKNFNHRLMVERYEALYYRLLGIDSPRMHERK